MGCVKKKIFRKKAQTIGELAIFGAILIFILGVIIRQALNTSYLQNQNLKAMRMAMLTSYEYTEGLRGIDSGSTSDGNASRNTASIILVEDRLTTGGGASKYGPIDRFPQIISGSGTHSRNLFMPFEAGEDENIPRIDFYVNGQHFIFTVAKFKDYTYDGSGCTNCGAEIDPVDWLDTCAQADGEDRGCPIFYTQIPNHQAIDEWCPDSCGGGNLSADERFDLDRDGSFDVPDILSVREKFAWQWYLIKGFNEDQDSTAQLQAPGKEGISVEKGDNLLVDVDGDLKEERVFKINASNSSGAITSLKVLDFQKGDIDVTFNTYDFRQLDPDEDRPGFSPEAQMWTFTKNPNTGEVTYLNIDEFDDETSGNQLVKSTRQKGSLDIIQRTIQLSNDTKRFCDNGNPTSDVDGEPNPVEVCCDGAICKLAGGGSQGIDCFNENTELTCMDVDRLKIFVRSRLKDIHGRRWITDIQSDDYIQFDVPNP